MSYDLLVSLMFLACVAVIAWAAWWLYGGVVHAAIAEARRKKGKKL
jgi:hypothetical protein